jgi:hypothetical protein
LRSKATIITINDHFFVYGGISSEFIESGFNLEATNQKMRRALIEDERNQKWDRIYVKCYNTNAPVWYCGYFSDKFKNDDIKKITKALKVTYIVVGHTSQKQVESLFKNRIFAVDTSIKNGVSEELLFIETDNFYCVTMDGQKIKIDK